MKNPVIFVIYAVMLLILSACQTTTQPSDEPAWVSSFRSKHHDMVKEETSPNLWHVIGDSFELKDYATHPKVKTQIAFYMKNKKFFENVSIKSEPYLYYVFDEIKKSNLPSEMIILPMIESGFDPYVYSRGKAAGIWQFVPGTGRLYGLKQSGNYDGRRDIQASTHAAVQYLQRLNKEVGGDWLLTLAAYNSGEMAIKRAIENNRRQGKKTDYFSLPLSKETQLFVPRILAIQTMLSNPDQYGITLNTVPSMPYFAQITLPHDSGFKQLASATGTDVSLLKSLNAGYSKSANNVSKQYPFLIPADKQAAFAQAAIPVVNTSEKIASTSSEKPVKSGAQPYKIKSGDTLSTIAKHFHVSVNDLKKWNPVNAGKRTLALGDTLYIYPKNK